MYESKLIIVYTNASKFMAESQAGNLICSANLQYLHAGCHGTAGSGYIIKQNEVFVSHLIIGIYTDAVNVNANIPDPAVREPRNGFISLQHSREICFVVVIRKFLSNDVH